MMVCDVCKRSGRSYHVSTVRIECRTVEEGKEREPWSEPVLEIQLCDSCQEEFPDKLTELVRSLGGGSWDDDLQDPTK